MAPPSAVKAVGESAAGAGRLPRVWEVDVARGVAVVMMAVYHLVFDLASFGGLRVAVDQGGWRLFADATAALFLLIVGVSLTLGGRSRTLATRFRTQLRRGAVIFGGGLLVTAATLLVEPTGYVRFGILHLIGVSVVLAVPFVGRPWAALLAGGGVVAAGAVVRGVRVDHSWWLPLGVRPESFSTLDYRPLAPWFGVVLWGVALGALLYERRGGGSLRPAWSGWPVWRPLRFLGRHAFVFYLVHQPVMLAVLWGVGLIVLPG